MTDGSAHSDPPAAPELVGPREATVVDGSRATFAWKPSREADRYRLQIAETARFNELVIDEEVGNETAVTVGNQLPTDGDTFFWRVRAGSYAGWGDPSVVESFIAGTDEESEQDLLSEYDAGPVTGLARAAKRDVPRRVFDFSDRFEEEKERGVAYEGIAATQIMSIAVAILVVILVSVVVIFGWFDQVTQETRAEAANVQNYELLQESEAEAEEVLTQYGVVDEDEGIYRIPVDEAMEIMATEEYERSQSGAQPTPSEDTSE